MERPTNLPKIDTKPSIATWELWAVAQMLVSSRGDEAETHAQAKLSEARHQDDEAGEIVWSGVLNQLSCIREAG